MQPNIDNNTPDAEFANTAEEASQGGNVYNITNLLFN